MSTIGYMAGQAAAMSMLREKNARIAELEGALRGVLLAIDETTEPHFYGDEQIARIDHARARLSPDGGVGDG